MAVDPFAAAQVAGSAGTAEKQSVIDARGAGITQAQQDPFVSAHDLEDPFATSSDFTGGDFTPSPPIETLRGRLLVMIPRVFDPKQPDPFNDGEFRELYTVDLYVLDGGTLSFPFKRKGDPEKGTADEYLTHEAELPFEVKRFWVPQGNLIGKLKKTHAKGAPLLGVLDLVPQKAGRDKGVTAAQIRAEYDAWVGRNRVGTGPRIAWALDDPSGERRKVAVDWWAANKTGIEAINTSTAPKS